MNKKAFTLIEILIVVALIGILAVAFVPSLLNAPAKARDVKRIADLHKINEFILSEVVQKNKSIPASACLNPSTTGDSSLSALINSKIDQFGGVFPVDPKTTNIVYYDTVTYPGRFAKCTGQYYYRVTPNNGKLPYVVVGALETESKGNVDGWVDGHYFMYNPSTYASRRSDSGSHYAVWGIN